MSTQFRRYDIIINGGGIVGFSLLNSIFKSPYFNKLKVLLIEQAPKPKSFSQPHREIQDSTKVQGNQDSCNKHFSNRVSSITKSSRKTFQELGVWSTVEQYSKSVNSIEVWNYDYSDKIVFKQNESDYQSEKKDRKTVFSVVENNRLSLALLDNIHSTKRADDAILWNHTLEHLGHSPDEGLVKIVAKGGDTGEDITFCTPLLLGCDGFRSKVREFSQMKYNQFDLCKTALVGTVKMDPGVKGSTYCNDVAYQRFSAEKDTVAAILPLDREYSSFVISAPNEYAKHLLECDGDAFIFNFNQLLSQRETHDNVFLRGLHEFTNSAYERLHQLVESSSLCKSRDETQLNQIDLQAATAVQSVVEGSRATFPLIFGTTTPRMITPLPGKYHPQIALLGDSSHRVHPLAGQGLNLGIQDTVVLIRNLETLLKSGERVFDEKDLTMLSKALKRYELERQCYIVPMSAGILSMTSLFKLLPTSMLTSVNKCDYIKTASVKFANGC